MMKQVVEFYRVEVVEAKKSSKDAAIGREQAKQYCYNIQKRGCITNRVNGNNLHQRRWNKCTNEKKN
jgi:type I site-specific restriction endonuclease